MSRHPADSRRLERRVLKCVGVDDRALVVDGAVPLRAGLNAPSIPARRDAAALIIVHVLAEVAGAVAGVAQPGRTRALFAVQIVKARPPSRGREIVEHEVVVSVLAPLDSRSGSTEGRS